MPRLITFGGLRVENGTLVNGVANPRSRLAILAVLAAAGDAGMRRDKLLALFWPENDEERARTALRQALFVLRRDLGVDELIIGVTDLKLNRELLQSDVAEFIAAVAERRASDAVALYAGPFLDGQFVRDSAPFEQWVDSQRRRFGSDYAAALESLATDASSVGELRTASAWWAKLAAHEPHSSRIALEFMRSLAASGDREAAIRHADLHARLVRVDLDAEPDPNVTALADELRAKPALSGIHRSVSHEAPDADEAPASAAGSVHAARPRSRRAPGMIGVAAAVAVVATAMLIRRPTTEAPATTLATPPVPTPSVQAYSILAAIRSRPSRIDAVFADSIRAEWQRTRGSAPPPEAFAAFVAGLAFEARNADDSAAAQFRRAVDHDPRFTEAAIWLLDPVAVTEPTLHVQDSVALALGSQLDKLADFDRATLERILARRRGALDAEYQAARRVFASVPRSMDAGLQLIRAALASGHFTTVTRTFHRMDGLPDPLRDAPEAVFADLNAHQMRGASADAIDEWRERWIAGPQTMPLCMNGVRQLAAAGQVQALEQAIESCRALPGAAGRYAQVIEFAARHLRSNGYREAARPFFERAIALRTATNPGDRLMIGLVQYEMEDWSDAATTLAPFHDSRDRALRVVLAVAAAHTGDAATVRSSRAWIDSIATDPKLAGEVATARAALAIAEGKREAGLRHLSEAVEAGVSPYREAWGARVEFDPVRRAPQYRALAGDRP